MPIKTEMLRYFIEVAESGNLATAAERLGRTPSAVSMMLKQMEENLGAPLFASERKNRLTPLGEFTLKEARRELAHFERTVNAIYRFAKSGEGQVQLACLPGVATALMPAVVQEMHAENPHVLIRLWDAQTATGVDLVRTEKADIAIVNGFTTVGAGNIRSTPILEDIFGIICRRDSPLGRKDRVHWSDIANETLIYNGLTYTIEEPHVRKASAQAFLAVGSTLTIQAFVRAGAGIAILPALVGENIAPDLVFRIPEGPQYHRTAHLVWNENRTSSPAVSRFCKILRKVVADRGIAPENTGTQDPPEMP